MNSELAKYLLIHPVHFFRGEEVGRYQREVAAVNSGPRHAIDAYQKDKLRKIIETASESALPHFRNLAAIKKGFAGRDTFEVLNDIPVLTKETVRKEFNAIAESGKFHWGFDTRSTSGSTGTPLKFVKDRTATGYMDAVLYGAYRWHGIEVGEPQARFWGMPLGARGEFTALLKDFLKNRIRFSAFDLTHAAKEKFYNRLMKFRPTYFYGYPSLIVEFCRFLESARTTIPTLKAVIGTGEYVLPEERQYIEQTLNTRFVNEYGCTEVGLVGFDCMHGSMHLMGSNVFVEVLKNGKRVHDEEGDVIVTELNNNHAPFLRYALGDRGVLMTERCRCGIELPVIKVLCGRKDDFVLTPEGNRIYDAIFAYTLKKGVNQFKAVQSSKTRIDIYVCANPQYNDAVESEYRKTLGKVLGPNIKINFVVVDKIERSSSGKLKYFENRVKHNDDLI